MVKLSLVNNSKLLLIAGVLGSDGRDLWTGKGTVLIHVGDILDRGEDEIAILSLLHSLSIQAEANGGAVFQVHGNHETRSVEGDFRYVNHGAFEECIDFLEYLNEHDGNWDEAFVGRSEMGFCFSLLGSTSEKKEERNDVE